ncbi:uncharacterized protein LOC105310140 isoform X1 [Pteropus vampyrus]|uniref:Uncharacterized protein LOC105310140 isoform X1 n=1 Tax=Pteropus vampyrus TaxID=132908 RepID=A0A6P6C4U7_PTEVA|nr:uncharacterized protein LOC105310140 isoform X1 [Pteropus vampyrus]
MSSRGPEDTCFEFGVFPAILSFPLDYPLSPPKMRFTCEMFHPNIYPDGRVCISILHAPGDDPMGYESSAERWSPVQSVEKILLSVSPMTKAELTWTLPKCGGMTGSSFTRSPSRPCRSPWGSEAAPTAASSVSPPGLLVTVTLCAGTKKGKLAARGIHLPSAFPIPSRLLLRGADPCRMMPVGSAFAFPVRRLSQIVTSPS